MMMIINTDENTMIMRVVLSFAFLITDNNIVMLIIMTLFFFSCAFFTDLLGD